MSLRRVGSVVALATVIGTSLVVFAAACGGDEETKSAPPPLSTGNPPPRPTSDASSGEGPRDAFVLEASPTSTKWAGTLAATETVAFGGGGYCNYKMTLKDVAIALVLQDTGDVSDATVRDLAFEEAVSCPYPPMDPSIQDFAFKGSTTTTTGVRVELTGAKANRPETSLVVDLAPKGAAYEATLTWKRTDQGPPLSWTVTAKIPLARQ